MNGFNGQAAGWHLSWPLLPWDRYSERRLSGSEPPLLCPICSARVACKVTEHQPSVLGLCCTQRQLSSGNTGQPPALERAGQWTPHRWLQRGGQLHKDGHTVQIWGMQRAAAAMSRSAALLITPLLSWPSYPACRTAAVAEQAFSDLNSSLGSGSSGDLEKCVRGGIPRIASHPELCQLLPSVPTSPFSW